MYKLMPRFYKERVENWLNYSGSKIPAKHFTNYTFTLSLLAGFIVSLIIREHMLTIWISVSVGVFALFHGFLLLAIDKRSKFVEKILPDALQLVAANMKSGYIPSRALLLSARKEFGPLSEAIKNAGKEMMTGKPLQESLNELTRTIKSEILETTVKLMKRGIKAGGQLVSLFEETAIDIRRKEAIKRETRANIMMYGIFIGFAGCVGAPALYALSSYLVTTISKLGGMTHIPEDVSSRLPLKLTFGLQVDPSFLTIFSVVAIIITTTFGSLIMGLIGSGSERAGIKYLPPLLIISLLIYYLTGVIISGIFSTLVPV